VHALDVDRALLAPRDRFAQRVVGGRRSEGEDRDARTGPLRGELTRLGDGAPAVRIHLELDAVAPQATVRGEFHLFELRDLFDQHRDAHSKAPRGEH
jgi:hypothetical protein